ncbi:hypothetical protein D3C85_1371340 [compost metagenome]
MGGHVARAGNDLNHRHVVARSCHQRGVEGHATALGGSAVDLAHAQAGVLQGQAFFAELVVVGQGLALCRVEVGDGAIQKCSVVVLDRGAFRQTVLRGDDHCLGGLVGVHGAACAGGTGRQRIGDEALGQGERELAVEHRNLLCRCGLLGRGLGGLRIQSPESGRRRQQQDNGFFTQQ